MARNVFFARDSGQRFNGHKDRLGFEYHPVATTKRAIVDYVMLVGGPLPQVVRRYFHETRILRPPQNPTIYATAKELGKDRDDIEA